MNGITCRTRFGSKPHVLNLFSCGVAPGQLLALRRYYRLVCGDTQFYTMNSEAEAAMPPGLIVREHAWPIALYAADHFTNAYPHPY